MNQFPTGNYVLAEQSAIEQSFITRTYGWMSVGLLVTAAVAGYIASTPELARTILRSPVFFVLFGIELVMVFGLSAAISRISAFAATLGFVTYAALNGATLSVIFLAYTAASLASTFVVTAGMFGAMCAYGALTKRDLTSVGSFMTMGLFGVIIASFANFWLHSEMIYWLTTYMGVFIFVGLTAYDAQKIKNLSQNAAVMGGAETAKKASIMGALALYLDFINLFLFLLRFMGRRRD